MDELDKLSSSEIANLIDEEEKKQGQLLDNYYTVEQEKIRLQKEILEKQIKKKDLESAVSKAGQLVRQSNLYLKRLKNKFWSAKNSGL